MPITAADAPSTLSGHAKEIYVSAWNNAYNTTCKKRSDRDECASKIAWAAVKKKYKKVGNRWVAKSLVDNLLEFVRTRSGDPAMCTCPKCGAKVPHKRSVACTTINCPKCGTPMRGDKATVVDATTTNLPSGTGGYLNQGSQYNGERKCPKCGAVVGENAKKCPKCGASLEDKAMELMCVKSLGGDRIGGYLALWGNENRKDLVGEFFSPETDFWLGTWGQMPILYHHGYNPDLQGFKSIVGAWDTFEKDPIGLWVEGELKKHHEYRQAISALIEEKAAFLSSGALPKPGYIVVEPNGYIKSWPIVEGSITPTPCEPRMASIQFLKAANINLDEKEVRKMDGEIKALFLKLGKALWPEREVDGDVETEGMPEDVKAFLESVVTQVATTVASTYNKALVELQEAVRAELDEMKATVSEFDARLDGTEKSIEAKVAEKFESLPPIVTAPVTQVATAQPKGDTVPVAPGEKSTDEFSEIVGAIVDGIMGKWDNEFTTPQLEVLNSE